jgi:hypothetical protein
VTENPRAEVRPAEAIDNVPCMSDKDPDPLTTVATMSAKTAKLLFAAAVLTVITWAVFAAIPSTADVPRSRMQTAVIFVGWLVVATLVQSLMKRLLSGGSEPGNKK